MFQPYGIVAWVVAFGLAVTLSGCGSPTSQEKQKPTAPAESKPQEGKPTGQGEHTGHEGHEGHSGHDDHAAPDRKSDAAPADAAKGLAELSDADRAAAEKQRVCPVSGLVLGAMGKPYKVTVKGKTVFLCCPGCEEKIMKNPDTYLAKLKADRQA
jgi:Cu(I)/Ag(I) efflux system membrane fusion protein